MVKIDFKQATELLAMFGGEPCEITLMQGDGHSGEGLYAVYADDPEGSFYLGSTDEDARPAAVLVPDDFELRDRWRAAGGSFHGPCVETGTMPEAQLLPFLRDLAASYALPATGDSSAGDLAEVQAESVPNLTPSAIAAAVCQRVAELDDRSSPADWPEAMLVTAEELQAILIEELAAALPAPQAQPADALDAARYRWLRDGNAYVPEESHVRGGDDLDKLCDAGIVESKVSK